MASIYIPGDPNSFQLRLVDDGRFVTVDQLVFVVEADLFRLRCVVLPFTGLKKVKARRVRAMLVREYLLDNRGQGRMILSKCAVDDIYCLALRHDGVDKKAIVLTRAWLYAKGMATSWVLGYWT